MRFYTQQHRFYCGVDLHARTMYLCILDGAGQVVYDKNLAADPDAFLKAVAPFRDGLVVAVECLFCWYWLADLCVREQTEEVDRKALWHNMLTKAGVYGNRTHRELCSNPPLVLKTRAATRRTNTPDASQRGAAFAGDAAVREHLHRVHCKEATNKGTGGLVSLTPPPHPFR